MCEKLRSHEMVFNGINYYQTITIFATKCELAFLTLCDQAFHPPFLGGKIIELAKFCFKNKRFEPSLSFFSKPVIVSHCV